MRIVTFLSIAALSSLSAWATGSEAVPDSISGPKIVLESNTLDLGVMKANEEKEDTVFFRNEGNEPLVIKSIFSDCGCTVPSWDKTAVAPGQSGMIRVRFNTKGRLPGEFRKIIRIRSNAVNRLEAVFIEGKVARRYVK